MPDYRPDFLHLRPQRSGCFTHGQVRLLSEAFLRYPVQETTVALVKGALDAKERFQISFRDAAIIEAARTLGCRTGVARR